VIGGCFAWDRREGRRRRFQHPPTLAHGTLWIRDENLSPSRNASLTRDVAEALTEFLSQHFDFVEVLAAPELQETHWFTALGWDVTPDETNRFPLDGEEAGWKRLDSDRRRDIRRARDRGFTVEPSSDAPLLAQAMEEMLSRRGAPHPPVEPFVEELMRETCAADCGQLFVCRSPERENAGAILVVWHGDQAAFYIGAATTAHRSSSVSTLLKWEAIRWCCRQGRWKWIDLCGGGMESITSYKKQFNAPPERPMRLTLTPDPRLRMAHHARGLWRATKDWVRGRRRPE
jgi:hypothetical protein